MTLVELLVILVIMGLAIGIAVPTLLRSQIQARANREMGSMQRVFDLARAEAMRIHLPTTVLINGNQFVVQDSNGNVIRRHGMGGILPTGKYPLRCSGYR